MNNGPGKSPFDPIPASLIASSATRSARRCDSSGAHSGSAGTKSTVPAIVVRMWSSGNRVIRLIPETPAVSLAQLSSCPSPSDVSTPIPVTTTIGRPCESLCATPVLPAQRKILLFVNKKKQKNFIH